MAPIEQRLRRLLQLIEDHPTVEEFAGYAVREIGEDAFQTIRLLFQCTNNDLRLIAALVALEAKEKSMTNPKKEN